MLFVRHECHGDGIKYWRRFSLNDFSLYVDTGSESFKKNEMYRAFCSHRCFVDLDIGGETLLFLNDTS